MQIRSRAALAAPFSGLEVARVGGVSLRPHDIDVSVTPSFAGAIEGTVSRLVRIGFEARITVLAVGGEEVSVVMSRTHQRTPRLVAGAAGRTGGRATTVRGWKARATGPRSSGPPSMPTTARRPTRRCRSC